MVGLDWDYPKVAVVFGWSLQHVPPGRSREPCSHEGTDGTVDCPECGVTVDRFLEAAYAWLVTHDGAMAEDPGYFDPSDPKPQAPSGREGGVR